jgi:predicted methyltransferase
LKENKVSRDALETQLDALWVQTLETVEIDSMKMDGQFNKIVPLPTGQLYRIIPTEIKMRLKANDSEIVSSSESLAIFEDGDWYFVRLDDANLIKMFHKSYPDFKVVEIMTPTMKIDGQEVAQ